MTDTQDIPSISADELKVWRAKTGWTQVMAARALHVPLGTLQNWEQGRRSIPSNIARLCEFLLREKLAGESTDWG